MIVVLPPTFQPYFSHSLLWWGVLSNVERLPALAVAVPCVTCGAPSGQRCDLTSVMHSPTVAAGRHPSRERNVAAERIHHTLMAADGADMHNAFGELIHLTVLALHWRMADASVTEFPLFVPCNQCRALPQARCAEPAHQTRREDARELLDGIDQYILDREANEP